MLKLLSFFLLAALFYGPAYGQTANSEKAKAFIDLLAKGDFAMAENLFSDDVKLKLTVERLREVWQQLAAQTGGFQKMGALKNDQDHIIRIICEFKDVKLDAVLSFDKEGKIAGLNFVPSEDGQRPKPAYEAPPYAKPESFQEREVTVGAGEWALPGTLTMPSGKGPFPAIVLVHGSGANDRDETIAGNKPFKDLAWGLASRGIAVLRYDKRNFVHGAKLAKIKRFTLNEETVEDAALAAELLSQTPGIDPKRIFVLGHSLGGMAIPRIGVRTPKAAGLIVFAGTARHIEDVIVEQYNYLFSLDGTLTPEEQSMLDKSKVDLALIKKLTAADIDSPKMYLRFFPVPYLLDLQNYDPPNLAKTLKQPMLILQGGRDYQVTMKDFANWKAALSGRKNVSFKMYPTLTHIFMEGSEKPTPADYEKIGHVDVQVVNDIAGWILKRKR